MNNITPRSSIRRAPGSFTPQLRNRHLKKPPSPIDWVEQSYIELIQDVSIMTMNYYETRINQNASLHDAASTSHHDETLSILQSLHDGIETLDCPSVDGDDDDDDYTTASSVYDLRRDLYQFYRDQTNEEPISKMSELSLITTESAGYISPDDVSIITTDINVQCIQRKGQYVPAQRKKKIFSRMIERMKLAAEKPFWSIESHF
jgi:hypothetical protein